ncbi:cytochrome ubiquinol oxidase subunit I [Castellaniella sp.]|uniref:cytochrome ubiquinol oxidase subunit I n=1 Tax=Castellaniella sp. TaxID=1955812 RepID=UPI00355F8DA0
MTQTAWVLSLSQFFLSLGFMLFFLALELGLAWILFALRLRARRGGPAVLAYRFWVRVFALSLVMGFAAALPVLLQVGTLWPGLMDRAGAVIGPLAGMTVLTAFFFKSCFLGAMLYGQRRMSHTAHVLVVGMVALGSSLTAWWVMVLLAWLQWPVGASLDDGVWQLSGWWSLSTEGAAPVLFMLFLAGSLLLALTLMLSLTARRTRMRPSDEGDRSVFMLGLWGLPLMIMLQVVSAAQLGRLLLVVQPARLATVVSQWSGGLPDPVLWWSWPARGASEVYSAVILHDWGPWLGIARQGTIQGLEELVGLAPPWGLTFFSARLAVVLSGLLMVFALVALWRGHRLGYEPDGLSRGQRSILRVLLWLTLGLQLVGWGHLLVGNLPYAVQGALTLRDALAPVGEPLLWLVFVLQVLVYGALGFGFRQLLRHASRYGVVPVARHRGHA